MFEHNIFFFNHQANTFISENTDHSYYRVIQPLHGDGIAVVFLVLPAQAPPTKLQLGTLMKVTLVKIEPAGN